MTLPLTTLLNEALAGDQAAAERAWSDVYAEIRAITSDAIAREPAAAAGDLDLHPTVVVHEIFLRIGRSPPSRWDSRRHFFGTVRRACDQVLVDRIRLHRALRRGGGRTAVPLTFVAGDLAADAGPSRAAEYGLPAALERLARDHPRAAEVARLRYQLGRSTREAATELGLSDSRVEKDWAFARAWLHRELDREA